MLIPANMKGKIEVVSRVEVSTSNDMSLAYTPWVAEAVMDAAVKIVVARRV